MMNFQHRECINNGELPPQKRANLMIPVSRRKLVGGRTNSVENMFVKLDNLLTRQNIFETSHLVFFYLDTKMCTHFGIKIDPPQSSRIQ